MQQQQQQQYYIILEEIIFIEDKFRCLVFIDLSPNYARARKRTHKTRRTKKRNHRRRHCQYQLRARFLSSSHSLIYSTIPHN